ncbi:Fatty-acid amide hydrolase 2 [Pseudolycoriella hygida]|uniref:Fatty-acid amide hydrolase 2 n=1 Tax=Pseudolycoriella hygida TaxID=35572 RepID=A0A9Q0MKN8_9DIPT|nr:Fatty-acid amide hydrolase 2 [Pseudolycoriella hygida]KAJ6633030.1 Fatty-acid amide hydrolase 2 [Pseudolycoriella hygida]
MELKASLREPSIKMRFLNLLHKYLCIFVSFVLDQIYGEKPRQSMPPINDITLNEPATTIAEKIRTKQITSRQVVLTFIERIKEVNPVLNCVVGERYEEALLDAAKVDQFISSNEFDVEELRETKPFLGVPISTKECIGIDGMIQSCGLWSRRAVRSTEDADVIQLMRNAGAIPFVTTNVPPLLAWCESANKIYGRTLNPYDTKRSAGGSSGGEAALLAAAGSPLGIGSDIGGSIRMPALFNGIFGHKPSPHIVSNNGHYPNPNGAGEMLALTIGPMSRFASDLKPMLKVLAGDKAKHLALDEPVNLSSLNYFYQEDSGEHFVSSLDEDMWGAMNSAILHFSTNVDTYPKRVKMEKLAHSMSLATACLLDKNSVDFESQLANMNGRINPFIELLKWCMGKSEHTLPSLLFAFQQRLIFFKFNSPEHRAMLEECEELRREFDEMLGDNGVFIYPAYPTIAPYHNEAIFSPINYSYNIIFNVLGLPSTSVPIGLGYHNMPVGVQVIANRNKDRLCLAVASEFERLCGGWLPTSSVV